MVMRTHELHPSLIHAPLVLLPAAALVDLAAAAAPRGDRAAERAGRTLWWAAAGSALLAGLAGMAASQEVETRSDRSRDMMFLHGIGNLGLVVAALGVATWRARNRASYTSAVTGLAATGAAAYTAYLGGELVYAYGVGVEALGGAPAAAPALFSRQGVARLGRDAVRGLQWLLSRGARAVSGQERVSRAALGPIAEAGTGAVPTTH